MKLLLSALVVESFEELGEETTRALAHTRNGSDAITRFIEAYTRYFLDRIDRFRASVMMRQMWGNGAFGLDEDTMVKLVDIVRRAVDPLERALLDDRLPSERAGGSRHRVDRAGW